MRGFDNVVTVAAGDGAAVLVGHDEDDVQSLVGCHIILRGGLCFLYLLRPIQLRTGQSMIATKADGCPEVVPN